ncbi:MAG TPA: dihydroxy-acid dehydratase, partial [Pusillimonas sp.]
RNVHCLLDLMPSGRYLMEDFFEAGGLPAILNQLGEQNLLHLSALTVNGRTLGENIAQAPCWRPEVVHSYNEPFKANAGISVLRGNLAPNGAIIKPSAASPHLLKHTGRAVVFESIEDLHARINDDDLDIDENCVMVLKYCGPKGYPGMAEVGNMPLPPKLLKKGINDIIRLSDARMSGTAYGTVVLHTSPEAAIGGPLALVQNGDLITLDVPGRNLHLHVDDAELEARRAQWQPPAIHTDRGYVKLYVDHVLQAHEGVDLDFLVGKSGSKVPRDNH